MPRTIVAGNWKMHKTAAETRAFFEAFLPRVDTIPHEVHIVVAPPFTALAAAADCVRGTRVALGAQNVHWESKGAFTGEISIPMLREFDVRYVIVGHSERRAYFDESDLTVRLKTRALLDAEMTPIICVGETLEERNADRTDERVIYQTREALDGLSREEVQRVVLAYEPIWAIGTGANCEPIEANRVMSLIRGSVPGLDDVPILYGGSVKPENIDAYRAQPNINGGLVGGASLDAAGFFSLIEAARG
jgi:triosephosphate isomerase